MPTELAHDAPASVDAETLAEIQSDVEALRDQLERVYQGPGRVGDLLLVTLLAAWIPALRATHVDPVETLHGD